MPTSTLETGPGRVVLFKLTIGGPIGVHLPSVESTTPHTVPPITRREKAAELRRLLADYRGCRFRVGGSGGADGMAFLRHPDGSEYFVGGFQGASKTLVAALNLVIELLYET